jgi:hypothetical protein
MPRGKRPSIAAVTRVGERKASEIVMLTCRTLHFSRAAICSTSVPLPVMIHLANAGRKRWTSQARHASQSELGERPVLRTLV